MIPGICPYCRSKLRDVHVRMEGTKAVPDAKGSDIRTTCPGCKTFIGYRPAKEKKP